MDFQITGIPQAKYQHLFDLDEKELQTIGAVKMIADEHPGFPCRVSLEDATIGEEVLLFPHRHHVVASPYQASGPIFIRKNASSAVLAINEIPKILPHRLLSLRVYNAKGMMINARTIEGKTTKETILQLFQDVNAHYIHIHNAGPGCYNCQVNRV